MRKTVTAVSAVPWLMLAASAAAQTPGSSVTMYGVVDSALVRSNLGTGTVSALESGLMLGSRLGFRGEEALSASTKAVFALEMGLNGDTGTSGQGGVLFGRQAFVGLTSTQWGRMTLGRHYSLVHTELATYTMNGLVWGSALNNFRDGTILRLDNSVRYESPDFAGLQLRAQYAFAEQPGSVNRAMAPSLDYKLGAWQIGATTLLRTKTTTNSERHTVAGTRYDFGFVRLGLAYYRLRDELPTATSLNRDAAEISAMVPLGVHSVYLSYGKVQGKARPDTDAASVTLRYSYALSKRTSVHAGWSMIDNEAQANYTINTGGGNGPTVLAGRDLRQAVLGVTHTF